MASNTPSRQIVRSTHPPNGTRAMPRATSRAKRNRSVRGTGSPHRSYSPTNTVCRQSVRSPEWPKGPAIADRPGRREVGPGGSRGGRPSPIAGGQFGRCDDGSRPDPSCPSFRGTKRSRKHLLRRARRETTWRVTGSWAGPGVAWRVAPFSGSGDVAKQADRLGRAWPRSKLPTATAALPPRAVGASSAQVAVKPLAGGRQ